MADINSTLGHPSQVSLIAVADVTNLLGGKRKVEWDASTDTTGKEAAVIVASQLVNDLTFSGWAIFHYPQPFALPRTATNCYDVIAAESGSSTTAIYSTYLKRAIASIGLAGPFTFQPNRTLIMGRRRKSAPMTGRRVNSPSRATSRYPQSINRLC